MRFLRLATVLVLVFFGPLSFPQHSQTASKPVWSWFADCKEKAYLGLEVMLNGEVIHRSSFPICPVNETSKDVGSKKIVALSFKGGYTFQGTYRTKRTQTIEGNIWQAGKESDAILLGVSFMTPGQVLLNTIHMAELRAESTSEIDRGLVVRTFPITSK